METYVRLASFLVVGSLMGIFFLLISTVRKDFSESSLLKALIVFVITLLLGFAVWGIINTCYKQGQIDALSGKIKYELKVNSDNTKSWEEIKPKK